LCMPLGDGPVLLLLRAGHRDPNLAFGSGLALAGDADGDGTEDFLVGCSPSDPALSTGCAQIVSGRTGAVLRELTHPGPDRLFGFAVAAAGDVDGDGRTDWLVGAPIGAESPHRGAAFVFAGSDGHLLREFTGDTAGFGVSVTGIGDWNGDGHADVAVGAGPE